MTNERTTERLREAANVLAMIEEVIGAGLASRTTNAGIRVSLRNAREAIIRSCLEIKQSSTSSSVIAGREAIATHLAEPVRAITPDMEEAGDTEAERIAMRRHDLRSNIERIVDRS